MDAAILTLTLIAQIGAAIGAFALAPRSKSREGWLLVGVSLLLMAGRTGYSLATLVEEGVGMSQKSAGLVLTTSWIGLLTGISLIAWRRPLSAKDGIDSNGAQAASYARIELALGVIDTSVWEWDLDSDLICTVTAGGERERKRESFPYASWLGRVHPEDRPTIDRAMQLGRSDKGAIDIEYRIESDQGIRWYRTVARVLNLESVPSRTMSGIQRDVTVWKRASGALSDAQKQLQVVLDAVADVVLTINTENRTIEYVNGSIADVLGYEPREVVGHSTRMLYLDDGDYHLVGAALREAVESGRDSFRQEAAFLRKDGGVVWGDIQSRIRRDQDPPRAIGVIRDVTARRRVEARIRALNEELEGRIRESSAALEALQQSESRFEKAFRSSPAAMIITSLDGSRIIDANDQALELSGHERSTIDGWQASHAGFWMDPPARDALFAEVREAGSLRGRKIHYEAKSGEKREAVASFEIVDVGSETCVLALLDDVTEQRRLEEELRHAQKMEALGRLAGGVAHDFNNLLTVIQGYAEILMDEETLLDEHREMISELLSASHRARDLVAQLLVFSRRQVMNVMTFELNPLLLQTKRLLERLIGEDVRVEAALDPDVGSISTDPGQLEQVMMNLAVNARDAMAKGGTLRIESSVAVIDATGEIGELPPGRYEVVSMSDDGVGMDSEVLRRVFEPFFTTKPQGKGTGLGLAMVYGFAQKSGGHVEAESQPGQGTTFRLYLPSASRSPAAEPCAPTVREASEPGHETILVVEDQRAVLRMIRRCLEGKGYRVLEAADGDAAIDLVRGATEPVDLVLTDIVLPGMRGDEVAQILRAANPALRVLLMSGYSRGHLVEGDAAGPFHRMQKPFTPRELIDAVRRALDE